MESHSIAVQVNGVRIAANLEPRVLLVHFLREQAGLTGTHIGCDTSQCGCLHRAEDGTTVKSCTVLAVQAAGYTRRPDLYLSDGAQAEAQMKARGDAKWTTPLGVLHWGGTWTSGAARPPRSCPRAGAPQRVRYAELLTRWGKFVNSGSARV